MEILYCVMLLGKEVQVNTPAEHNVDLSWAPGMIGALPVFDTYEAALNYCGREDLISVIDKKVSK